ncbi:MAG: SET domain-containing protein-lysine N-methyltransferase [Candidatus Berkelbacteria bacterium]|nr:SET domain-containing protein-lysine N-methyltransferase [Candidatus Berkelbacteria bacterium]
MGKLLIKKKSNIHGIGIFTTEHIGKNSVFYVIPINSIFNKPKSKCAYVGRNSWVSDEEVLNYVNHSCEPNSILDISDKPRLIAKRDIKKNEEITVDYSRTEKNGIKVPCVCKSKNCKKYFLRIE